MGHWIQLEKMADQFDVSGEQRKILQERAKRRLFLRNEFIKQSSDPFRHASGEGGTVFDPALQRYQAMKVNQFEYFKPNVKTARYGFFLLVLPYTFFTYWVYSDRAKREASYRNGEVAYKDRNFKFI